MGFTWDEDMNAMDIPMLNQKEESSESEEEEDPQLKVLCTSVACTGDTTWWLYCDVSLFAPQQNLLTQGNISDS